MFTLRSFFDWVVLRASVNRDRGRMKNGYEMFHHPGSSRRFTTEEYAPCPRCHHTSTGAYLATDFGPAARAPHRPSARMSPPSHPREGRFREAGASPGLRKRLREDRRQVLLGEHAA